MPDLAVAGGPVPELSVDLPVPSFDGRFRSPEYGGRAFDSAPGLAPALDTEPIVIKTGARLLSGDVSEFTVRVPTVELALVIKALAYGSRQETRDIEDIYRLLENADAYTPDEIGGWRLREQSLKGSRRDAAAHLHNLARRTRSLSDVDVPTTRLATLVAARIGRPERPTASDGS